MTIAPVFEKWRLQPGPRRFLKLVLQLPAVLTTLARCPGCRSNVALLIIQFEALPEVVVSATLSQFAQSLSVETAFTVLGVARQLKAAGKDVEYQVYDHEGHGWKLVSTIIDDAKRSDAFLVRTVLDR